MLVFASGEDCNRVSRLLTNAAPLGHRIPAGRLRYNRGHIEPDPRRHMLRIALLTVLLCACAKTATPRSLDELVIRDSTYVDPETLVPYTGRVFRTFEADPHRQQIQGVLADGIWDGELIVYHENGRVRYSGSFANGERCGPWLENRDAEPPKDIFFELKQDIESMGLYPECPS